MFEDDVSVVDAHHHLWDLEACHYPWLMARGVRRFFGDPTPIQKNYLVADLLEDAAGIPLQGSVHVQVGAAEGEEVKETEWLQECSTDAGLPSAIVAYCDLAAPSAPQVLEQQRNFPSVRGIRQIIGRSAEEDALTGSGALLGDATWRRHLALLPELKLSFDLQLSPLQVPAVVEVLEKIPALRVALCHCGSPWDQSEMGLRSWRGGLETLARLPNIYCKLSGFGMFDHDWTVDSIRPIVHAVIDVFGPRRCMLGSNFPVDKLHADYGSIWSAYDTLTADLSNEERRHLFGGTAREFYRLTP